MLLKKEIENYEEALKNPYFGRVDFVRNLEVKKRFI